MVENKENLRVVVQKKKEKYHVYVNKIYVAKFIKWTEVLNFLRNEVGKIEQTERNDAAVEQAIKKVRTDVHYPRNQDDEATKEIIRHGYQKI